ncbi:MAG: DUF502 domain-containing protein [Hyphomicrobiales bacterium]|nr:DUF502 domain-containing protein [Hyphomicrobiales bacterium]
MGYIGRYILAGILTVIPLWVTWLVVDFVFRQLLRIGSPIVATARRQLTQHVPELADRISWPLTDEIIAILLTLGMFYLVGWIANRVIGRQILSAIEAALDRLPLVQTIYGGVKKLIGALQQQPDGVQRVVLIDFPSKEMKAVGLVTRVMTEEATGRQLAIVYVPTTPNPTSGYLEVVPIERVVSTDWTLDEAMNFVISAGAVAPERITFSRPDEMGDIPPDIKQT